MQHINTNIRGKFKQIVINKKGNSYIPGGFSTESIPHVNFTSHGSVSKIHTQEVCKTITFVSDVGVPAFITDFHNK